MDNNPIPLNPGLELDTFLTFLYREQEGLVYVPTKNHESQEWTSVFFEWPQQRSEIKQHIQQSSPNAEVYIGPALYSTNKATKENVKGTYTLWTEFDGLLPDAAALKDVPAPTLRVRSSESSHEHWYWALDHFIIDVDLIERSNRGITYTLGADASSWDATQILRPPTTTNHKRGKTVITLSKSDLVYSTELFNSIPVPEAFARDIVLDEIPDALDVVAKYKWIQEAFLFFRNRDIPTGQRSSALMRLGYYCAEMHMLDEEAYAILDNADQRWGKFVGRNDRERRLLDIINRARLKYPLAIEESEWIDDYSVFDYVSFLETDLNIEWLIPNVFQKGGTMVMSGPPGAGKSSLSLRFAMNMALGKPFLGWDAGEPCRMMFISMEMGHAELKHFVSQMAEGFSEQETALLEENLLLVPLGYGIHLDKVAEQQKVTALIKKYEPVGVFFDTLGSLTPDELSSETVVKAIFDYNDRIRAEFGLFTWFIHHNRKAQSTNKRPNKMSDVYGSQYIAAKATTVLGIWPDGEAIEVTALKIRLAAPFKPFTITRADHMDFKVMGFDGLKKAKKVVSIETPKELIDGDTDTGAANFGFD